MEMFSGILLVVILLSIVLGVVFLYFMMKQSRAQLKDSLMKESLEIFQQSQQRQRDEFITTTRLINENARETFKNIAGRIDEIKKHQQETSESRERSLSQLSANLGQNISSLSQTVNKQLGETLEKLGEFKELSKGVDNLSKVLSNVKQKGKFGEYQLESIIMDLVPSAYYHKEYTLHTGNSRGVKVDFVIRLPGKSSEIMWLPIDSKFPLEPYERLLAVRGQQDSEGEKNSLKELFKFFKEAAQSIKKKYIVPPETTDFAILFIPHESIFLEVYQDNTFVDMLRKDYNVIVTGPNHFYALLHMLQMGYTKLAIEKRSQALWEELTRLQDNMKNLTETLMKTERKAAGLHDDIRGVHLKAGKLTKNLNVLEKPSDSLLEEAEDPKPEEEVLEVYTKPEEILPSTKSRQEEFDLEKEKLKHYRAPLTPGTEESAPSTLFE